MCKLTRIVLVSHSRLHFVNICLHPAAHTCLLSLQLYGRQQAASFLHPHLALVRKRKALPPKPQVSLTAPKTNGLWLAAVTNSLIIDFMILHLKLLYNNTQKCLMGSIQSHKNYLLNKRFKTINLLFSINNGFPKNRRQLNVSSTFSPGKVAF